MRYYKKLGYYNRKIMRWTNSFCIKFLSSIFISIHYAAFSILLKDLFSYYSFLFFINSAVWLISCVLLYFEYRRKLNQSWFCLRGFWFLNGAIYFTKILVMNTIYDEIKKVHNFLVFTYIQASFSTLLLYFSIFKPTDYEIKKNYCNENQLIDNLSDNININLKPNEIHYNSDDNFLSIKNTLETNNLLQISLTEVKPRKYSHLGSNLVKMNKEEPQFMEHYKLRIKVKFNFPSNITIKNNSYHTKKSLVDVLNFNMNCLEIFEKKIKILSPLTIQLKNLTEILAKKYFTTNSNYDFQDDSKNFSKSSQLSAIESISLKIKNLEKIYNKLCKNYLFFQKEFLKFLEIKDNELIENVMKFSLNTSQGGFSFEKNNFEITKNRISGNSLNNNLDFFSEADEKSVINNDLKKTMCLINNIIVNSDYINVQIVHIRERSQMTDTLIEANINLFESNQILIYFTIKQMIDYLSSNKKNKELREFFDIKNLTKSLKKDKNKFKSKLSELLSEACNDLFYLDNELFILLELNKIVGLEINELDYQIVISFFEFNKRSNSNLRILDCFIKKEKNILNYMIYCDFQRVEKLDMHNNSCAIV